MKENVPEGRTIEEATLLLRQEEQQLRDELKLVLGTERHGDGGS